MKIKVNRTIQFDLEEIQVCDIDFDVRTYNCVIGYLTDLIRRGILVSEYKDVAHLSALILFTIDTSDFAKFRNVGKKTLKVFGYCKNELIELIKNKDACLVKIQKNNTF